MSLAILVATANIYFEATKTEKEVCWCHLLCERNVGYPILSLSNWFCLHCQQWHSRGNCASHHILNKRHVIALSLPILWNHTCLMLIITHTVAINSYSAFKFYIHHKRKQRIILSFITRVFDFAFKCAASSTLILYTLYNKLGLNNINVTKSFSSHHMEQKLII